MLAFKEAADAANKSTDGLTRASLLTALKGMTSFDAGGMTGTVNIGGKVPSSCFMVVQWKSGKFNRIYPKKAGTFDCTDVEPLHLPGRPHHTLTRSRLRPRTAMC